MSFFYAILICVGVGFSFAIVERTRTWLRLRHIPGPFTAGLSELWLLRHTMGGRMHMDAAEVCEAYGELVRVGPNEIITSNPDIWRKTLAVRSGYRRSNWYDSLRIDPTHDNVVSQRNDEKHNELRAKMAAGYSGKENEHLERSIDNNIESFIKLIETKYLSTETDFKPMDFAQKAQFFTLDVISDIAFGKEFGYLRNDKDMFSYIKTTEDTIPIMMVVGALPWMAKVLHSRIFKRLLPTEKDLYGLGKVMGIAKQVVGERFGPNKKMQRDMLEARKLPYLQAVIKEGLRIFPPVVGFGFKDVPKGGDTIAGYFVPENTKVGYCTFGLFLDEKLWGQDARMFRPERWLRGSQEEIRMMEANLELIFSYGRWQCLGKGVAQIELNKVLVELLRNFDLTIVNPREPLKSFSAGLFIQSDMWLRVTKREPRI